MPGWLTCTACCPVTERWTRGRRSGSPANTRGERWPWTIRDDFIRPRETSQLPLFRLLGFAESDKRHAVLQGGHIPSDRREIVKEVLNWLDRHLGPV